MQNARRRLLLFILLIGLPLIFHPSIFAASITLSDSSPGSLSDINQEYQVNVNLSINTADGTIYYLRGVFYQVGTDNYCGYTWNGSNWFSGPYSSSEGWKNFLTVTIASSSATTLLKAKLDTNDSGCRTSGNYNFKVQRFTQSGSSTFDSQNEQTIVVVIPTATPTSIPVSTDQPTSAPTPSPSSSQITPTKKPTATATKYTITPELTVTPDLPSSTESAREVLGESNDKRATKKSPFILLIILLGVGIGCIGAAVVLSYRQLRERRRNW